MPESSQNDKFEFHNDRYDRIPKSLVERWLDDEDGFGLADNEPIQDGEDQEE